MPIIPRQRGGRGGGRDKGGGFDNDGDGSFGGGGHRGFGGNHFDGEGDGRHGRGSRNGSGDNDETSSTSASDEEPPSSTTDSDSTSQDVSTVSSAAGTSSSASSSSNSEPLPTSAASFPNAVAGATAASISSATTEISPIAPASSISTSAEAFQTSSPMVIGASNSNTPNIGVIALIIFAAVFGTAICAFIGYLLFRQNRKPRERTKPMPAFKDEFPSNRPKPRPSTLMTFTSRLFTPGVASGGITNSRRFTLTSVDGDQSADKPRKSVLLASLRRLKTRGTKSSPTHVTPTFPSPSPNRPYPQDIPVSATIAPDLEKQVDLEALDDIDLIGASIAGLKPVANDDWELRAAAEPPLASGESLGSPLTRANTFKFAIQPA